MIHVVALGADRAGKRTKEPFREHERATLAGNNWESRNGNGYAADGYWPRRGWHCVQLEYEVGAVSSFRDIRCFGEYAVE